MDNIFDYLTNMTLLIKAEGWNAAFYKAVLLLLLASLVFYICYFFINKTLYSKSKKYSRDQLLRLNLHRALGVFMVIFSVYIFFVFRENGTERFRWGEPAFYSAIFPQLLTFIAVISLFLYSDNSFSKKLTNR